MSAASDDEPVVAPRRSLALPILLALVLALSIGAVMVFSSRSSKAAPDAAIAVIDASPDTAVVVVARDTAPDAAPDAEEPDAGVDAGRVVVRDARRNTPPPDAAVVVAPPPEVAPVGTGKLTARGYSPTNTYLDVVVDGKTIGRTPLLGAELAAGPHTVTLVNPVGAHEVMHTEKIVIVDGKTTTVTAK